MGTCTRSSSVITPFRTAGTINSRSAPPRSSVKYAASADAGSAEWMPSRALAALAAGCHVTFDDAYRSVANAIPILERLQVPATVFACPGYADEGRPLDVPELADEALAHPEELATMGWEELRGLVERGVEIGSACR